MARARVRMGPLLLACAAGCSHGRPAPAPARTAVDSVVLERTICYGTCPAYRLSLRHDGVIHFQSKNHGDTTAATDRVSPAVLDAIVAHANSIRFAEYPDDVTKERRLCKDVATDHPTIIIGLFGPRPKQVLYYTGCYIGEGTHGKANELVRLGEFAKAIDSLTRSSRWVRPNPFR